MSNNASSVAALALFLIFVAVGTHMASEQAKNHEYRMALLEAGCTAPGKEGEE